jgi:hypothetical protein
MNDDRTHQIALALLRLQELGDTDAVKALVAGLTPEELRAVLVVQTSNVADAFAEFARFKLNLAIIAAEFDRPFPEVRQDYLYFRILRAAGAQRFQEEP